MTKTVLRVRGLDCVEEVKALRAELQPLRGVAQLDFDVLNAKMTVSHDAAVVSLAGLIEAVSRTGMSAEPWRNGAPRATDAAGWSRWGRPVMTSASGILTALGFAAHVALAGFAAAIGAAESADGIPAAATILYLAAVVCGGWFVAPKAWHSARRLRPDMNLLMTIAVVGAMGLGEWFEAATVYFLFSLSLTLESWSVGRARKAIASLMALAPLKARVWCPHDKREEMKPVENVSAGSLIVVRPGEQVPLDGEIAKGHTSVNQAPITGESQPVEKSPGDEVFAGTINQDGAIEVRTTKPAGDTTLAHIIKMVGEAQGRRAPSERWVEKFARIYTPAVMILAAAVAVVPPLLFGFVWAEWFYRALVLLVIACPCALVISTPVSIVSSLTSAARHGVLVKGGLFIEEASRLKALALDKTGTLTEGRPEVRSIHPMSGHTEDELLTIAAAIEARSEHPLGRAIVRHARKKGMTPQAAESYRTIPGKGASATLEGHPVWIGSHRYVEERGQEPPGLCQRLNELSDAGKSVVVVGNEDHVCGFIAVADAIRPNAREAMRELKLAGIKHIAMLTGDNRATAESVGRETGVDEVLAELLPEDKVAAVEELVKRHGHAGMVGDGVNDAPAMARSSLGIAMGVAGTDAALETADIALMTDDLTRLGWLIGHSRRTLSIIRQNIFLSLAIKALFVALTFAGLASLWAAIAADMGVSLAVVFNALRLLRG